MRDTHLPHPVDIHVGTAIRLRRKSAGMSQQQLAQALNLTFQQIQKYERGTNRISASKLYEVAVTLRVPIGHFFAGYADPKTGFDVSESETQVSDFLRTGEGVELAQTFPHIQGQAKRRKIVDLIRALSSELDGH